MFTTKLFEELNEDDSVVCSNGAACVITFQAADIKKGQRLYTNSGCAAMGYGLPAAVGASVSEPDKRIICVEGDGSFMMNTIILISRYSLLIIMDIILSDRHRLICLRDSHM